MKKLVVATGLSLLLSGAALAQAPNQPTVTGRAAMSDTQIKQRLEQQGYTNVNIRDHNKGHVDVMASKNGQNQKLTVDPATGQAMPDTDND